MFVPFFWYKWEISHYLLYSEKVNKKLYCAIIECGFGNSYSIFFLNHKVWYLNYMYVLIVLKQLILDSYILFEVLSTYDGDLWSNVVYVHISKACTKLIYRFSSSLHKTRTVGLLLEVLSLKIQNTNSLLQTFVVVISPKKNFLPSSIFMSDTRIQ